MKKKTVENRRKKSKKRFHLVGTSKYEAKKVIEIIKEEDYDGSN